MRPMSGKFSSRSSWISDRDEIVPAAAHGELARKIAAWKSEMKKTTARRVTILFR